MSATSGSGTDFYAHGPDNKRIWKQKPNGTEEIYFYGISGQKLGTYRTAGNGGFGPRFYFELVDTNLYFGSKMIISKNGTTVLDRLGSVRNWSGLGSRNYPYGEEEQVTVQDREKFATYYRDGTTGLDYAQNRYYANTMGRFTSPDPYKSATGAANPQEWNKYAYVIGDPINYYDPAGLFQQPPDNPEGPPPDRTGAPQRRNVPQPQQPSEPIQQQGSSGVNGVLHDMADAWRRKVVNEELNDCQALAGFAGQLAKLFASYPNLLVSGFRALIQTGSLPAAIAQISTSSNAVVLQPSGFLSGFREEFRDSLYPNSDQAHHFAAFIQFGFKYGSTLASKASYAIELENGLVNKGDIALGGAAGNIGASLANGSLNPSELATKIRDTICDQ